MSPRRGLAVFVRLRPGAGAPGYKMSPLRGLLLRSNRVSLQERIIIDPNVLVGKPIIKGTRLSVEFVIDLLARGWTREQILHEYDHLTPEDIQACLAYARDVLQSERVYPVPAA